ncbi:hypothetical protein CJF27_18260 [Photobacterium iliopiscarium]|nr:hypothetical protein [Photobacterium iliopiscarium]
MAVFFIGGCSGKNYTTPGEWINAEFLGDTKVKSVEEKEKDRSDAIVRAISNINYTYSSNQVIDTYKNIEDGCSVNYINYSDGNTHAQLVCPYGNNYYFDNGKMTAMQQL